MTGNQLKIKVKNLGLTQVQIAEQLKITVQTLHNWFKLDELDPNQMANLKSNLSDICADDDCFGGVINYEQKGVPYYDVDFIAGFDLVENNQTQHPAYYIDFPEYNSATHWVNVSGRSMEPLLSAGDIVAIKELPNWEAYILYGEVYAIVTDEYRTIKRIRKATTSDKVLLVPINPDFDEQEVPKNIIRKVFQVQGCAKKIF